MTFDHVSLLSCDMTKLLSVRQNGTLGNRLLAPTLSDVEIKTVGHDFDRRKLIQNMKNANNYVKKALFNSEQGKFVFGFYGKFH